jgi:hypothetical protein
VVGTGRGQGGTDRTEDWAGGGRGRGVRHPRCMIGGAGSWSGGTAEYNRGAALTSGPARKVGPSVQQDRWTGLEKEEKMIQI